MSIGHAPGEGAGTPYRSRQRRRAGVVLLTLGPFAAAVVAGYFWVAGGRFASTENAYVKTYRAAISAEVAGQIARVLVRENE